MLDINSYYFHLLALPVSFFGFFYQEQLTQLVTYLVSWGLLFLGVRSLVGIFSEETVNPAPVNPARIDRPTRRVEVTPDGLDVQRSILRSLKPKLEPKPEPVKKPDPEPTPPKIVFQTVVLPDIQESETDTETSESDQESEPDQEFEPDQEPEPETSFWSLFFPSSEDESSSPGEVTGFQLYQEYFQEKYPEVDLSQAKEKWDTEVDKEKYQLQADICNANLAKEKEYREKFQLQYHSTNSKIVSELDQFKDYWLTQIYPKLGKKLKPRAKQLMAADAWTKLTRDHKRRFYYQAHEKNQIFLKKDRQPATIFNKCPKIMTGESLFANRHRAKHLTYLNKLEQEDREDELLKAWQKLPSKEREHYRQLAYDRASREVKQFLVKHPDSYWTAYLGDKEKTKYFNLED